MEYSKQPISIDEQIRKLKERGLIFENEPKAAHYLSNISYYRLRAYTHPFQDNANPRHPFVRRISFEQIIELYVFDRKLRLLIFNAVEKIEIALRAQIIHHYAMRYGSHWHLNENLYSHAGYFAKHLEALEKEIDRSQETFIKHYFETYTNPSNPPCWMALEVTSIGLLSKLFENLKDDEDKKQITKYFGLKSIAVLENWIFCFSGLRNICAHHGRVWNRRISTLAMPRKVLHTYILNKDIQPYKIYNYLVNIQYILNVISPNNNFKTELKKLLLLCPIAEEREMGFPIGWRTENFWQ